MEDKDDGIGGSKTGELGGEGEFGLNVSVVSTLVDVDFRGRDPILGSKLSGWLDFEGAKLPRRDDNVP